MTGNSDKARLIVVFELTVAAFCSDVAPAIVFDYFDNLADFHAVILHHFELPALSK